MFLSRTGTIEPNKSADFIVINQNLLENTSQKIHETKGLEGLKGFKGKVLKTSLTKDKEKCEDDDEDDSASVHWL